MILSLSGAHQELPIRDGDMQVDRLKIYSCLQILISFELLSVCHSLSFYRLFRFDSVVAIFY